MADYSTLEQVKIRLEQFHIETVDNGDDTTSDVVVFDKKEENPLIEQLISQAEKEVSKWRKYPSDYTEEQIDEDLKDYQSVIVNLAVYDYSQAGESYMESYSENGISRNWKKREDLLADVLPIAKLL